MARAMLAYTKEILEKVSFDVLLFTRELEKATRILLPYELIELRDFVLNLVEVHPALEQSLVYIDDPYIFIKRHG